jgi:hypothetical protein
MCDWVTLNEQTCHKSNIGYILRHCTCCNGNTLLFKVCVPNMSPLNITSRKGSVQVHTEMHNHDFRVLQQNAEDSSKA